jgi:hypothetical protein
MKENEAYSWEQMDNRFKNLQTNGITPVIIHHANREGKDMRDTSKREDPADCIIKFSANNMTMDSKKFCIL